MFENHWRPWLRRLFRITHGRGPRQRPGRQGSYHARHRPEVELLESRLAPASATIGPNGQTLYVNLNSAAEQLSAAATGFNAVTLTSTAGITLSGQGSASGWTFTNFQSFIITDGAAGTSVKFTDSGTNAYQADFQVSLTQGSGGVSFAGTSDFNSHPITVAADGTVNVAAGAVLSTSTGGITLDATNHGLFQGGRVTTTGTGNLWLEGHGQSGTTASLGMELGTGSHTESTASGPSAGTITLRGFGGTGNGYAVGIDLYGLAGAGYVTSVDGAIDITGQGAGSAASQYSWGIVSTGTQIIATGKAPITLNGSGGLGGPNVNGVAFSGGKIQSADGAIQITASTASATIPAFQAFGTGAIAVTGAGSVSIAADSIDLPGTIAAGTNAVSLRPKTAGTAVNLGGADAAGTLGLTNTELNHITAGTIAIGDPSTGPVSVSAAIQHAGDANLVITSGQSIDVPHGGSLTTVAGDLTLVANEQATPNPLTDLAILINGLVATQSGDILIQGRGGATAPASVHSGIEVFAGGRVISTGAGTITLDGTGGATTAASATAFGIAIGSFTQSQPTSIQSAGGAIHITGNGGGAAGFTGDSTGVTFLEYGQVIATGGASVTIDGTAGTASAAGSGVGVSLGDSNSGVTAADGAVQITGTGGAGPGGHGVSDGGAVVQTTGAGTVAVTGTGGGASGDGILLTGASAVRNPAGADVTLTGTGAGAPDIQFPSLTLAKTGGNYTFDGAVQGTTLTVNAGAYNVRFLKGGSLTNPVTFNNAGTVQVGDATGHGILGTATATLNGNDTYAVALDGTTAGDGYGQLSVTGGVSLGGATLELSAPPAYVPHVGDQYVLVNNASANPVGGTFAGLGDGAVVSTNFLGSGLAARISYRGGDGNDVVLRVEPLADLAVHLSAGPASPAESGTLTYSITVTNNGITDDPNVVLTDAVPAGASFVASSFTGYDPATGQVNLGTVAANGGSVSGTIVVRVPEAATYTDQASVAGDLLDPNPGDNHQTVQTAVADAPLTATATPVTTAVEGVLFSGEVATFTDANAAAPLGDFPLGNVTILWGDGGSSHATNITQPGGPGTALHVYGSHTYAEDGPAAQPLRVTVTDVEGGVSNTTSYAVTVKDAPLTGHAASIGATAGAPFTGTVATFTDLNTGSPLSDFTATINWGDGTSSPGTVGGAGGSYTVTGSHTYAAAGNPTALVVVRDAGGAAIRVASAAAVTASTQAVGAHQSASMAFWNGAAGQTLIQSFNGGPTATALSAWLAANFPNLYGASAGTNNNLAGKTNTQVGQFFQALYAQPATNVEAEALAVALNIYATTSSLGGNAQAMADGFAVSAAGLGAALDNVGTSGAALSLYNNTAYSVWRILKQVNARAVGGTIYSGSAMPRSLVLSVLDGINSAGGM